MNTAGTAGSVRRTAPALQPGNRQDQQEGESNAERRNWLRNGIGLHLPTPIHFAAASATLDNVICRTIVNMAGVCPYHGPRFGRLRWRWIVPPRLESVAQDLDCRAATVAPDDRSRHGEPDWERFVVENRPIDQ